MDEKKISEKTEMYDLLLENISMSNTVTAAHGRFGRSPGLWHRFILPTVVFVGLFVARQVGAETLVIEDFEDVSDWSGLALETSTVKVGSGAGRWSDTVSTQSVRRSFDPPLDLSGKDHIGLWMYSAAANGAGLQLIFESDSDATAGPDYYSREIVVDWQGWRWFWISKEDLSAARSPMGWNQIQAIKVAASGWGHDPQTDTDLVFDQLVAASSLVEEVVRRQQWSGGDFVYQFEVLLEEPDGTPMGVDVTVDAPSQLQVQVAPAHVDLSAHGTAVIQILVTVPAALLAQVEPYHQWDATISIMGGGGVGESWSESLAAPPPRVDAPRTFLDSTDFGRIADWAQAHPWASAIRDGILARADSWPQAFENRYGLSHWGLPPEGGQWTPYYVCPVHGVALHYEPPMTHRCPVDGATYSGWPYDQVIYGREHDGLAKAARDLAMAWQLTGDLTYAQQAVAILVSYADRYLSYPIHDVRGGQSRAGARVLAQTLDESIWLISMAWAYDMVQDSGLLDESQRDHVEQGLLRAAAAVIARNDAGGSNWQAWHNAAVAAAGRAMDDPRLVAWAVNGEHGFFYHMDRSVSSDGFWYEGSWGYHFYTLSAMTYLAELGKRAGLDLFGNPKLQSMYQSPILFAPPDLVLPAFNDSHALDLRTSGRDRMDVAFSEYGDEEFLLPLVGGSRPESALFWGAEDLPSVSPPPVSRSLVFEQSGYAILRGGTETDPWWAALDFGPHGGWHGHYDKLNFVLYARGRMLGLDPGSHSYALPVHDEWDRSTVAHDTVVVDERMQNAATGELERFQSFPGLVWARADAGGAASPAAVLARDLVMVDGYVLDRFTVDATDGQSHQADWFWHAQGSLHADDLVLQPYSDLPQEAGYQYLADARAAASDRDQRMIFSWDDNNDYPGSIWASDPHVEASQVYDASRFHGGSGAARLDYDFSGAAPGSYVLFSTRSMGAFSTEIPEALSLWIYGDGSENRVSLRIIDDTGESHVSPSTLLDFSGWRKISFDIDDSWSHWSGNDDGVIDLPLSRLVLQLKHEEGGALSGNLGLDDWELMFPNAGTVTAEDYERLVSRTRLWVAGQADTLYVTAQGVGPDLTEPVDCFFVRRSGQHIAFDVLHEPHGSDGPKIMGFSVLSTNNGEPGDAVAGYRVETLDWADYLVIVGRGRSWQKREFGEERFVTDGVLAWIRISPDSGALVRLALADGRSIKLDGRDLFNATTALPQVAFSVAPPDVDVLLLDGDLGDARLLAPGTRKVTYQGRSVPFTMDGDYVVFASLVGSQDGGVDGGFRCDGGFCPRQDGQSDDDAGGGSRRGCGCRASGNRTQNSWFLLGIGFLLLLKVWLLHYKRQRWRRTK